MSEIIIIQSGGELRAEIAGEKINWCVENLQ